MFLIFFCFDLILDLQKIYKNKMKSPLMSFSLIPLMLTFYKTILIFLHEWVDPPLTCFGEIVKR